MDKSLVRIMAMALCVLAVCAAADLSAVALAEGEDRDLVQWIEWNPQSVIGKSYLKMSVQDADKWGVVPSVASYNEVLSLCSGDTPWTVTWQDWVGRFQSDFAVRTGSGFVSMYAERVTTEQQLELDLRGFDSNAFGRVSFEWRANVFRGANNYTNVLFRQMNFDHSLLPGNVYTNRVVIAPDDEMTWGEWYGWMRKVRLLGKRTTGPIGYLYDWHAPSVDGRQLLRPPRPSAPNPEPARANTKEPINAIDGCMNFSETDIIVPTPGIPLVLKRTYISTLNHEGPLGPRWVHTHEWAVASSNTVFKGTPYSWLVLKSGHGPSYWFEAREGGYESPLGLNWTLAEQTNGGHRVVIPPDTRLTFDSDGVLRTVSDYWNNKLTYSYSNAFPNHILTRIQHSSGQSLEFAYSNAFLVSASAATNLGMAYDYNAQGELVRAVRTASGRAYTNRYLYDAAPGHYNHSLTQRVNNAGQMFCYAYATNSAGHTTSKAIHMVLGTNQYEHTVDYGRGRTRVAYKGRGGDRVLEYVHDPELKWVDHISLVTGAVTNENGEWEGAVVIASDGSEPGGGQARRVDQESGVYFCHDQQGNTENVLTYDNSKTQWLTRRRTHDSRHNVVSENFGYCVSPGGASGSQAVPWRGITQSPPLGGSVVPAGYAVPTGWWSYAWHPEFQLPTRITDPEGNRTEFEYTNAAVSRVKRFYSESNSYDTVFAYTNSLLAAVTNANGNWTRYAYDALGRPSTVTPQAGPEVKMEHTPLGHLRKLILPGVPGGGAERVTTFETDALGRIASITYPDGKQERFFHDALGNITGRVDRAGRPASFTFAPTRKLTSASRAFPSAPGGEAKTRLEYDNQFNSLRVWDATGRCVERYELDLQERPVTVSNVESQAMHITYGVGDYVDEVRRFDGSEVVFEYGSRGRLANAVIAGTTNSFTYDMNGVLRMASNAWGAVSNTYDRVNRLTRTVGTSPESQVSYAYLPGGQVSVRSTVAGQTRYGYDTAERPASIESGEGGFVYSYHPHNGRVASCTCTNSGLIVSYQYDILDRVTSITWSNSGGVMRSFGYTYDDVGMITRIEHEDGTATVYRYDALDRLTGEEQSDADGKSVKSLAYEYDLSGNRLTCTRDTTVTTYSYPGGTDGNRLAGWSTAERKFASSPPTLFVFGTTEDHGVRPPTPPGGVPPPPAAAAPLPGTGGACAYDAAGCVTGIANVGIEIALDWDEQYRLEAVSSGGKTLESYAYDALGRRIRITSGAATNFLVHSGPHVVAEVDAAGTLLRSYTYGPGIDNVLAMTVHTNSTTNTYYFLKDHLGTVHTVVDNTGATVESYTYDAWGNVTARNAFGQPIPATRIGNRYLFQGREYSWQTGLYYFRARWYDPNTARWLSKDPIRIAGGLNQYVFCGGNAVCFTDPLGLYEYGTANWFVGWLHELNPFNMDGSINNQFAGGWAMLLGDMEVAADLSGYGQLEEACAGTGAKVAYWGSLGGSAAAISVPSAQIVWQGGSALTRLLIGPEWAETFSLFSPYVGWHEFAYCHPVIASYLPYAAPLTAAFAGGFGQSPPGAAPDSLEEIAAGLLGGAAYDYLRQTWSDGSQLTDLR